MLHPYLPSCQESDDNIVKVNRVYPGFAFRLENRESPQKSVHITHHVFNLYTNNHVKTFWVGFRPRYLLSQQSIYLSISSVQHLRRLPSPQ